MLWVYPIHFGKVFTTSSVKIFNCQLCKQFFPNPVSILVLNEPSGDKFLKSRHESRKKRINWADLWEILKMISLTYSLWFSVIPTCIYCWLTGQLYPWPLLSSYGISFLLTTTVVLILIIVPQYLSKPKS